MRTRERSRALRTRLALVPAVLCAGVLLAACGSGGSSTITIGNENKSDNALIKEKASEKSKTKTTETSTKTVTTPTSGPLSKEPKVTPPAGPAPKKLEIKDLIVGKGAAAKDGDMLTVNYVGVLYKNGKEFDASWKRNEPFSFTLGEGVIKGWDEGLVGMKVGGRRELVIPASLAYGAKGSGSIGPNEPLVFVIDLLSA